MDKFPGLQSLTPKRHADVGDEWLKPDSRGSDCGEGSLDAQRDDSNMAASKRSSDQNKTERHKERGRKRHSSGTDKLASPRSGSYRGVSRLVTPGQQPGHGDDDEVSEDLHEGGERRPPRRAKSMTAVPGSEGVTRQSISPNSSVSGLTLTPEGFETQEAENKIRRGGTKRPDSAREKRSRRWDNTEPFERDYPAISDYSKRPVQAAEEWSPRNSTDSYPNDNAFNNGQRRDSVKLETTSVDEEDITTAFGRGKSSPTETTPVDAQYTPRPRTWHGKLRHASTQSDAGVYSSPHGRSSTPRESTKHRPSERSSQASSLYSSKAEKLPMTGYELLAARISSPDESSHRSKARIEPKIKPIYRRFEALNHRLLLHLQDELSELEEQLQRLDLADTQTRRHRNGFLPASRRDEYMFGGELQWQKTDILGKIGFKLGQYNKVLRSFAETQRLPPASLPDVEDYRAYLAMEAPISESETHFLDPLEDLLCLVPDRYTLPSRLDSMGPIKTAASSRAPSTAPASRRSSPWRGIWRVARPLGWLHGVGGRSRGGSSSQTTAGRGRGDSKYDDIRLAYVAGSAIVCPVVAFPFIPDFVGRMAVVLVTGLAVGALWRRLAEAEPWLGSDQASRVWDVVTVAVSYLVVMAVVAAVSPGWC